MIMFAVCLWQSALDLTGYGGRVVLGSWYGGGAAKLNLGMAFHRSHFTIQTSQASVLVGEGYRVERVEFFF